MPDGPVAVGLISGTSMDGIDAVTVALGGDRPRTLASLTLAFDQDLAERLERARHHPDNVPARELGQLDALLGEALAKAALTVIERAGLTGADITVIGSHGQTLLHRPDDHPRFTLQIGDPHRIARRTGVVTVGDFRRADLAAGGQGAPLAPLLHDELLRASSEHRAVINLGGIANVSLLPPGQPATGFDSGPANCLLDQWYRRHHAGRFDDAGRWAGGGTIDPEWLESLLADTYFTQPPPKSTGIEYFSREWLTGRLPGWAAERPADIQATLAELTARSIAGAMERWSPQRVERAIFCGGGVHNDHLMARVARHLEDTVCETSAEHGIDPDHVESTLFAWLALKRMNNERVDTASVTGARASILAGTIVEP